MEPVLGPDGWCSDPVKIADYVFMHYLFSNHSQTELYPGMIMSFPYDLSQHLDDTDSMARAVEQSLVGLFIKHFSNIDITVKKLSTSNTNEHALSIVIKYTHSERQYNFSKNITFTQTAIRSVIDIINGTTTEY